MRVGSEIAEAGFRPRKLFLPPLQVLALVLMAGGALAAPKVDKIGPVADPAIPDAIRKALAPQGYRVTLDDGSTVDLWPRAQISTSSRPLEDATYTLAPSLFLGIIRFQKNTRDYRGDAIAPGTYNLRYAVQPNDGNHLGTSPTPDFLLLVPPAADGNPDATYGFEQLVELSRQVTGKKHPAPFNLLPAETGNFPSVSTDADGHTILSFKIKTVSGDLPLALVVKGTTTE
jgi:hypothetical protein